MDQNTEKDFSEQEEHLQDSQNSAQDQNDQDANTTDSQNEAAQKLAEELAGAKDKYLRLVAEFDNFRKRTARERIDLIKTAGEDIMLSILDVLDDAERAENQLEKTNDLEALKSGVHLIFSKLRNSLKGKGLVAMESLHHEFNPELHEAISEVPAPEEDQKGKVLDEVQKGYYLNDKIIRHAKVIVGK